MFADPRSAQPERPDELQLTLVYGAIALLSATESAGLRRMLTVSGSAGFILATAASRMVPHCGPDVGLGLAIGMSSLALFGQGYLRCRAPRVSLSPLLVIGGVVLLALHGRELDAEQFLRAIAGYRRIHCAWDLRSVLSRRDPVVRDVWGVTLHVGILHPRAYDLP